MYESSGSQFFITTTGMQSGPDIFDESRFVMTFLTMVGVMGILCSFSLLLEGKTGKEIPESSRLEFLEKFLANNFALSDAEGNTSGPLYKGGIADLPLLRTHRRNAASLSLFYRYYFGRCSSELAQMVPLPYSRGRSTRYSDRLHDFSVTIPRCYKDVYVNSFFPRTARLWNSLPIECFPLTYDLSEFKSRINRYLLTVGSF